MENLILKLESLMPVINASVETGLIFAILAMGVVLTFKILNVSDLSVEGTFPFGAFVFASCVINGMSPFLGLALSFVAGILGGLITYLIHEKLKIDVLLSSILTMTLLYSVNLRTTGKANVPLFNYETIFTKFSSVPKLAIIALFTILIKIILDRYFKTEKGYLLIMTGDNDSLVKSIGKNPKIYVMIGLMLANGLVALSGSLMAQYQGFVDAQMGATMIVTGLASIIIGDTFMKNNRKLKLTTRAIIGAVVYRIISGLAIHMGLKTTDLKAVTALIVIAFIFYNNVSANRFKINLNRNK